MSKNYKLSLKLPVELNAAQKRVIEGTEIAVTRGEGYVGPLTDAELKLAKADPYIVVESDKSEPSEEEKAAAKAKAEAAAKKKAEAEEAEAKAAEKKAAEKAAEKEAADKKVADDAAAKAKAEAAAKTDKK